MRQPLLVSQIIKKIHLKEFAIKKASNTTFRPRSPSLFTSPPRGDFTVILEPRGGGGGGGGGGEGDVYLILGSKDERVSDLVWSDVVAWWPCPLL